MTNRKPGKRPSQRPAAASASDARAWNFHYPEELPICARRTEICAALRQHQVVIIAGDTGSGKTTQLPKMCLDAGRQHIACTQPRRVAAVALSRRVAEELHVTWGREVGCKIRFMDRTSRDTAVKFVTDGMLLAEMQADPELRAYDTVIVDEAHERSLNIDFLLGHLNQLRQRRRDLKIVITSATIDTAAFSRAFDRAPVIEVSGRLFPVEVIYSPVDELLEEAGDFTHLDAVVVALERILIESDRGDILVFLATERDIRETADLISARKLGPLEVLPMFGRLSGSDQQRVFAPARHRKVVLSTNIAETSLTIPGIRFVIDTGEARISRFNNRTRTRRLPIERISQSSANQRMGRCGRVAEGVCIRLYSEEDFKDRPLYATAEIQRANLADVILRMKAARLGSVETFPFIDPPPSAAVRAGYGLLEELGALDAHRDLTALGRELARLPVDPIVGRMLLQAIEEKVIPEVLVIAAALSIPDPRERPVDAEAAADAAHKRFVNRDSDFLTLLAIWNAFHDDVEKLSQGRLRKFCRAHFLNYSRMREWRDVHAQLSEALGEVTKDPAPARPEKAVDDPADDLKFGGVRYRAIHRALLPGLLANVAQRDEGNRFRAGGERKVVIFPGSTLFDRKARRAERGRKPSPKTKVPKRDWIVAAEIVETAQLYARTCARIDVQWILELGGHACVVTHRDPGFQRESGRVLVRETTRLHGLELRTRSVGYGRINPAHATEIFLREALVNDVVDLPHRFLAHNRARREKAGVLRTRLRGAHYVDLDEALYRFYAARLTDISSVHDLNRVIRDHIGADPDFLCATEEDLLGELPVDFDREAFPDSAPLENSALSLHYAYKPGDDSDGVTLQIEPSQIKLLQPGLLDWLVPGHLEEKITLLLRGLPKDLRRQLVPIPEKATRIARELRPTRNTLVASLSEYLEKHYGVRTFPSDWKTEEIPAHLQVRVEVVGADRKPLVASRKVEEVRTLLDAREREAAAKPGRNVAAAWRNACAQWERTELETWTFDDPPPEIAVTETAGLAIRAYPGLRVEATGVALRLFKTPEESLIDRAIALERFFAHELRYELGWLDRDLKDVARLGPLAVTLVPLATLKDNVREHLRRYLCTRSVDPFTRKRFEQVAQIARNECKGLLWRLLDQLEVILNLRNELQLHKSPYPQMAGDLARLVPPDFLLHTSFPQLAHLPRYLRAMDARAKKARENPGRDQDRARMVARFERRLEELNKRSTPLPLRDELRWMLEEFRVSIFAQELGTAAPVSEKRLERKFAEVDS